MPVSEVHVSREIDYEVVRGDDAIFSYQLRGDDNKPMNLTGVTFTFVVTRGSNTYDASVVVNAAKGEIHAQIDDAVTATWAGDCKYKLRAVQAGVKSTIVYGKIEVVQ